MSFSQKMSKKFGVLKILHTFAIPFAEIAQLVEHNLAKVGVASSSLVFRSKEKTFRIPEGLFFGIYTTPFGI